MSATMEPRIQYAKTNDGVDIAFATAGDGPPLLMVPPPALSHVQAIWEFFAHIIQPLAERFHLVWYDSRGSGLSDREAIDFSMDAMVRDAEAVVEGAELTGLAMVAYYDAVPIAVTYAAIHPEKVSCLVLADGWMKGSDWDHDSGVVLRALRGGDWTVIQKPTHGCGLDSTTRSLRPSLPPMSGNVSNRKLCFPRIRARALMLGMSPLFCRG